MIKIIQLKLLLLRSEITGVPSVDPLIQERQKDSS